MLAPPDLSLSESGSAKACECAARPTYGGSGDLLDPSSTPFPRGGKAGFLPAARHPSGIGVEDYFHHDAGVGLSFLMGC